MTGGLPLQLVGKQQNQAFGGVLQRGHRRQATR